MNFYFKRRTQKNTLRLAQLLMKKDFKQFDALIEQPIIKKSVAPYERYLLQFNSYLARKDERKMNQVFAAMNDLSLSSKQKINFYGAALSYYAQQNDKKRAKIAHDKILSVRRNSPEKIYLDQFYQVMMQDKLSLLPVIERRVKNEPDERKASDYYLLSHLYAVKGEKDLAREMTQKADQLMTDLQKSTS